MKSFVAVILLLLLSGFFCIAQDEGVGYDKFIFQYNPEKQGIQTCGGNPEFTYYIYNQEGLVLKSGRLKTSFINLPADSFPTGVYHVLFRGKYRYINKEFTIIP